MRSPSVISSYGKLYFIKMFLFITALCRQA